MSEYARRHMVCSSWHRCPEGWHQWTGSVSGYTERPFCELAVGHAGEHQATISSTEATVPTKVTVVHRDGRLEETVDMRPEVKTMTWPNKMGVPLWLMKVTQRGLTAMREHVYERDQTECEVFDMQLNGLWAVWRGVEE